MKAEDILPDNVTSGQNPGIHHNHQATLFNIGCNPLCKKQAELGRLCMERHRAIKEWTQLSAKEAKIQIIEKQTSEIEDRMKPVILEIEEAEAGRET